MGKKKAKRLATTLVKEMAREQVGQPKQTRVIPDRRRREKHKKKLEDMDDGA